MSNKTDEIAIKVSNLHKVFQIPNEAHSGLKQNLINKIKGKSGYHKLVTLNGVSFEIHKGEFFGIVGRNGSGKSTLLKTMAGIYKPNGGEVHVNGKLVPFIELGVGFNPELTGRENVYLNGALLGFGHKEMSRMYDDIVAFAELNDFMEEKLKNYSSGMQVRLAFSIAIRAQGDILLLDEVLAVGDQAFQQKCYDYFGDLRRLGKTVILVTHDMSAVERFCSRAMLLDQGKIKVIGANREVSKAYSELFTSQENAQIERHNATSLVVDKFANAKIKIQDVKILVDKTHTNIVNNQERFSLAVELVSEHTEVVYGSISLTLHDSAGNLMLIVNSKSHQQNIEFRPGNQQIEFELENIYTNDSYSVSVYVAQSDGLVHTLVNEKPDLKRFRIKGFVDQPDSPTHPAVRFKIH